MPDVTHKAANLGSELFLVLFPAGVGCLLASVVIDSDLSVRGFAVAALSAALVLAVAGALFAVSGIKKPARSYRFLKGIGRSPLSRQAFLVLLFIVLLIIHWALVLSGNGVFTLAAVTVVLGAAATGAVGLTYWLKSQPGWRHWSTVASLFGGALAVGAAAARVIALAWPESLSPDSSAVRASQALLIAGAGILAIAIGGRSVYLSRGGARTREIWAVTRGAHRDLQFGAAVLVMVTLAAASFSFVWPWAIILGLLAAVGSQSLQWRSFFVTSVPLSWRTEVRWSLPPELLEKGA